VEEEYCFRSMSYMEKSVIETLHRGDLIETIWIDAACIKNLKQDQIEEKSIFATYKKVSGEFYGILKEDKYGIEFLVIITRRVGIRCTIVSIPLSTIQKITIGGMKRCRKKSRKNKT
jgi:hypothetical protein